MPQNIVYCRFSSLGDILIALSALLERCQKADFTDKYALYWIIDKSFYPLVAGLELPIEWVVLDRKRLRSWKALKAKLPADAYFIDSQGQARSAIFGFYGKFKRRYGVMDKGEGFGWLYDMKAPSKTHWRTIHQALWNLIEPEFAFSASWTAIPWKVDRQTTNNNQAVRCIIAPGSRGVHKQWPIAFFARVAESALSNHWEVIWVGLPDEEYLFDALPETVQKASVNKIGKTTINELLSLLADSTVLLTNDSGTMHVADTLGTPLLALFGASDPRLFGPTAPSSETIYHSNLKCRPCGKIHKGCADTKCLTEISPAMVWERLLEIVQKVK